MNIDRVQVALGSSILAPLSVWVDFGNYLKFDLNLMLFQNFGASIRNYTNDVFEGYGVARQINLI